MLTLEHSALTILGCLTGDLVVIIHTTILFLQPLNTIMMEFSGLLTLDLASCKNFGYFPSKNIVTGLLFELESF